MKDALLEWFDRTRRDLPWRVERTPYRALVSELMLQQTQTRTATPYFERWTARFPSVQALAESSPDEVLKAWEGLGYYARARNLHKAAQRVAEAGAFPTGYAGWLELPGVGPYTAAALASVLDHEPVLAVDGNVRRVAARFFGLSGDLTRSRVEAAFGPVSAERPGDFNEALMDLGALVCTPKSPDCPRCPLQHACVALRTGRVSELPTPKPRAKRPHRERYAVVDIRGGNILLRQRGPNEMLSGLWGFVLLETPPADAPATRLEPVEHAYTHFSTTVTPVLAPGRGPDGTFVPTTDLGALALSALDRKIIAALERAGIL